jgi:hypothetical protein
VEERDGCTRGASCVDAFNLLALISCASPRSSLHAPFHRVVSTRRSAPYRAPRGRFFQPIRAALVLHRQVHFGYVDWLAALRSHTADSIVCALSVPSIFSDDLAGISSSLPSSTTGYTRAYVPPSTPRAYILECSQIMAPWLAAHTGAIPYCYSYGTPHLIHSFIHLFG